MSTYCARCGRPIKSAGPLGPKCARAAARVDTRTGELWFGPADYAERLAASAREALAAQFRAAHARLSAIRYTPVVWGGR